MNNITITQNGANSQVNVNGANKPMTKRKLVPFSIEKVKTGAKVVTRNGLSARIVDYKVNDKNYPVLGLVAIEGIENPYKFTINGKFYINKDYELDLFIEEEEEVETEESIKRLTPNQDGNIPNGAIVYEDLNGDEGFYKVHLDYLNKKQVEEIEETVRTWNTDENMIKACIGMCLTDASEQRFRNYNTNLKDCLAWLEKQGKQKTADNVAPKFKAGDKVVLKRDKSCVGVITYINFWNIQLKFNNKKFKFNTCWCSEEELEPYEMAEDENKAEKEVKTRRMTNQELSWWLRDCQQERREVCRVDEDTIYSRYIYRKCDANEEVPEFVRIRKNSGEWQEPLIEEMGD